MNTTTTIPTSNCATSQPGSHLQKDNPILSVQRNPATREEVEWVNESLASAIATLSAEEEELILFDLYGFPSGLQGDDGEDKVNAEPPTTTVTTTVLERLPAQRETIQSLKQAVERRLGRGVPADFRKAYEFAMQSNPYFLEQQAHLFIASVKEGEHDNLDAAAEMLLNHLKIKAELFPATALGRHIRWTDLCLKDQELVSAGCLQFASRPDISGRVVLHWSVHPIMQIAGLEFNDTIASCIARAFWYVVLLEAQTNAKMIDNGVVVSMCNICDATIALQSHRLVQQRIMVVPFRLRAIHVFYTCPGLRASYNLRELISFFNFLTARRHRYRTHYVGSVAALKEQMAGFGIEPDDSPWKLCEADFSEWSKESFRVWLERRRELEQTVLAEKVQSNRRIRPADVLFGRTRMARNHPGNVRCKTLVDLSHDEYENSDAQGKTRIANRIVDAIYKAGGRFLRLEGDEWIEVSPNVARQKVGHNFRFLRNKGKIETITVDTSSSQ